jgi:hypothetical protein
MQKEAHHPGNTTQMTAPTGDYDLPQEAPNRDLAPPSGRPKGNSRSYAQNDGQAS